jgi:uncharacterized cupin superfamily protein
MTMIVRKPTNDEIFLTHKWGFWSKEPSEFQWDYDQKETCYILRGKAEVVSSEGEKISFQQGDWVIFEQGLKCSWKISEKIEKKFNFE